MIAKQCSIRKEKHPHHEWPGANGVVFWCAGVIVPR